MPTVYCYPVKLTIADLIRAKSICSQTQFSNIINRLLTSFVHRSVHTKKPRSDISQYRPHARSISRYYRLKAYFCMWKDFEAGISKETKNNS
jgi:hypothetical protein